MDAYDLLVECNSRSGRKLSFKIDVKDYTSARTLGKLIEAQEGDRGGAEWLVIPDHRASQVQLLSGVGARYGINVTTASEFGERVCQAAGVKWHE
jgi:hypothetical protein